MATNQNPQGGCGSIQSGWTNGPPPRDPPDMQHINLNAPENNNGNLPGRMWWIPTVLWFLENGSLSFNTGKKPLDVWNIPKATREQWLQQPYISSKMGGQNFPGLDIGFRAFEFYEAKMEVAPSTWTHGRVVQLKWSVILLTNMNKWLIISSPTFSVTILLASLLSLVTCGPPIEAPKMGSTLSGKGNPSLQRKGTPGGLPLFFLP